MPKATEFQRGAARAMTTTQATGAAVTEELQKRGIDATWEYPGTICVCTVEGCYVVYGTANGIWAGDNTDEAGTVFESLESTIPADSTDVNTIAEWIACNTRHGCWKCGYLIVDGEYLKNEDGTREHIGGCPA